MSPAPPHACRPLPCSCGRSPAVFFAKGRETVNDVASCARPATYGQQPHRDCEVLSRPHYQMAGTSIDFPRVVVQPHLHRVPYLASAFAPEPQIANSLTRHSSSVLTRYPINRTRVTPTNCQRGRIFLSDPQLPDNERKICFLICRSLEAIAHSPFALRNSCTTIAGSRCCPSTASFIARMSSAVTCPASRASATLICGQRLRASSRTSGTAWYGGK